MSDAEPAALQLLLEARVPPRYRRELDLALLRRVVERVLLAEALRGTVELSLLVTGDKTVRKLNREYRGKDSATDVLSFPLLGDEVQESRVPFAVPPDQLLRLGDVVISMPKARAQAKEYAHGLARELGYLAVHGVLHLLGYDHENEAERQVMRAKEEAALSEEGLGR